MLNKRAYFATLIREQMVAIVSLSRFCAIMILITTSLSISSTCPPGKDHRRDPGVFTRCGDAINLRISLLYCIVLSFLRSPNCIQFSLSLSRSYLTPSAETTRWWLHPGNAFARAKENTTASFTVTRVHVPPHGAHTYLPPSGVTAKVRMHHTPCNSR